MKPRESDFIEDLNGVVFDVKGLIHPPDRVVSFPRFVPSPSGSRKRKSVAYEKIYALSERFAFLNRDFPQYLVRDPVFDETLCEVPLRDITRHYVPVEKVQELRESKELGEPETKALRLAETVKEIANIPCSAIGVSGSILVNLHTPSSDIDLVVYGSDCCRRAYSAIRVASEDPREPLKPYSSDDLKVLFGFRSKDTVMGFEDFVRTESRKALQGKFIETDYFVRFVKDWSEVDEAYGDVQYKNLGYAKIKATIADDSESIFTPCRYVLEDTTIMDGPKRAQIIEVASFRGRFCEQAKKGETVIAQGKVERVIDLKRDHEYLRLLIGNRSSDYMLLA